MMRIQYYGAVDLENPMDGCLWKMGNCPENICSVERRYGNDIGILRYSEIFQCKENRSDEKREEFLSFLVDNLIEDIYECCGGDKNDITASLCMICIIPCEADVGCRNVIRRILKEMKVGQVFFVTKEVAAMVYLRRRQEREKNTSGIKLFMDAGELRGTVAIIRERSGGIDILERMSDVECGAKNLDRALLNWMQGVFGAGFHKFKTNRKVFREFLRNWIDGRVLMENENAIKLDIGDLNGSALRNHSVKIVSNGYANKLSLPSDQICQLGAGVFQKVLLLLEKGIGKTAELGAAPQILMNGCYLSFPPLQRYAENKKMQMGTDLVRERTACLQGALAMTQEIGNWPFIGVLKRSWGIVTEGEDGEQHFEVLLPGGEELPLGYEKSVYAIPQKNRKSIDIYFCSVPIGWQFGQDTGLLSCEKHLQVVLPAVKFPKRKIQVGMRVLGRLQVFVHDLTSGNCSSDEAEARWERIPDFIIEADKEKK